MNKKWMIGAIIGALFLCFINAVQGILLPFVLAFVLAYLLDPLVNRLTRHIKRPAASGIVVGTVVILCVLLLFLLLPVLQAQLTNFIGRVPMMAEKVWGYFKRVILWGKPEISYQQMYHLSDITTQTAISVLSAFGVGLNRVISGGLAVVNVLALIFITPIVLFYILKDLPMVKQKCEEVVPNKYRLQTKSLMQELDKTLSGFLRGQACVCALLACYYAIALTVIGLDLGAVIGLTTGLLSFIPYVGFFIGLVVSVVLALIQSTEWSLLLWVLGIFMVGNVLEGYILTPHLVGRKVGLHPAWILFALLAGGALFGFLGVLVAVPVAAIIGVVLRHLYARYQTTHFYKGDK